MFFCFSFEDWEQLSQLSGLLVVVDIYPRWAGGKCLISYSDLSQKCCFEFELFAQVFQFLTWQVPVRRWPQSSRSSAHKSRWFFLIFGETKIELKLLKVKFSTPKCPGCNWHRQSSLCYSLQVKTSVSSLPTSFSKFKEPAFWWTCSSQVLFVSNSSLAVTACPSWPCSKAPANQPFSFLLKVVLDDVAVMLILILIDGN